MTDDERRPEHGLRAPLLIPQAAVDEEAPGTDDVLSEHETRPGWTDQGASPGVGGLRAEPFLGFTPSSSIQEKGLREEKHQPEQNQDGPMGPCDSLDALGVLLPDLAGSFGLFCPS